MSNAGSRYRVEFRFDETYCEGVLGESSGCGFLGNEQQSGGFTSLSSGTKQPQCGQFITQLGNGFVTQMANGLGGVILGRQRCMRKRNMVIGGNLQREGDQKRTSRAVLAFREQRV